MVKTLMHVFGLTGLDCTGGGEARGDEVALRGEGHGTWAGGE